METEIKMMQLKRKAADRKEEGAKETLALSGLGRAIMERTSVAERRAPARGRVRSVAILDIWCLGFRFIIAPHSWTQNLLGTDH